MKGQGVCDMDNGGPLVLEGSIIGISSWKVPCALGYPDTFTRVANFRDWIFSTIESN